jgi:ABC-2 type transport system ATP-binding protein
VLRGLDGTVDGRIVGLLGPNGAGKTTLLATLLGFYPITAGGVRLLGQAIGGARHAVRARLGYMPENEAHVAGLSAVRFVRLMAELSGLESKAALERAHEALFYVGLGEARYRKLETYSLGMRQLAKLAQAIVHGPNVLLLDEPTNGLDPAARQRMLRLVREIADSGVRVVLSSHLLRDVEAVCDQVIVLKDGRVATIADLSAERGEHRRFLELEPRGGDVPGFLAALGELGCEVAELPSRRAKVVLPPGLESRVLWQLAQERGVALRRLTLARHSLEHLFMQAMEQTQAEEAPRAGV